MVDRPCRRAACLSELVRRAVAESERDVIRLFHQHGLSDVQFLSTDCHVKHGCVTQFALMFRVGNAGLPQGQDSCAELHERVLHLMCEHSLYGYIQAPRELETKCPLTVVFTFKLNVKDDGYSVEPFSTKH